MSPVSDSIKPRDVCIVGVARTPIGGLLGTLSSLLATQLGSIAIQSALKRANVDPTLVQEVYFGNVLSANLGQALARQAALGADIPTSVICTSINKVCASGMKATMLSAQTIQLGINDVVVAGGMESMSNCPKLKFQVEEGGLRHLLIKMKVWESLMLPIRELRPSFKEDGGTVTAGNASCISDSAAALVLVSGEKALQLGLQLIAKIKGSADAAEVPELFTTSPALAIPKAISNAGLEAAQIDYYEINEAFSVVALANQKLLGLNPEKINVHGGAVSLGHLLGCGGSRILVTLLGVLRHKKGKYGVGAVCNGEGGAYALVFELMPDAWIGRSSL